MMPIKRILGWTAWVAVAGLFGPAAVFAQTQPSYECDNRFGQCGTPNQSGGGGCGGGGSILINNTDLGETYQNADDYDNDGLEDPNDNCPKFFNQDQTDSDGDGHGEVCDNCLDQANADQANVDGDELGNVCDPDIDGDAVLNGADNCASLPNATQTNTDGDSVGDACDEDIDGDGIANLADGCPMSAERTEGNGCDLDDDLDGAHDYPGEDNCVGVSNSDQADANDNGVGDACDTDRDGDGVLNPLDNCAGDANAEQVDLDRDGSGDSCDGDFCYVVLGNSSACLDPEGDLMVYVPTFLTEVGRPMRMPAFVNRDSEDAYFRYTWRVVSAPSGSGATIVNPNGVAGVADGTFELDYNDIAHFTPDVGGAYSIEISIVTSDPEGNDAADTVGGDAPEYGAQRIGLAEVIVNGEGSESGGCSVAAVGSTRTGAWLALGALWAVVAVVRRRVRRG